MDFNGHPSNEAALSLDTGLPGDGGAYRAVVAIENLLICRNLRTPGSQASSVVTGYWLLP